MAAPSLTVPPFTPPSYVVGGGGQAVFPFSFPYWDDDDIIVRVNGATLDPSTYEVDGYTVQSGSQVSGGYGSGQVTLNAAVTSTTVVIDRFVQAQRDAVYGVGAPLPVTSLNADFNRLAAMLQDTQRLAATIAPAALLAAVNTALATAGVLVADTGSGT